MSKGVIRLYALPPVMHVVITNVVSIQIGQSMDRIQADWMYKHNSLFQGSNMGSSLS